MFPDSEIAKQFVCGSQKSRYISTFGLGPHFQSLVFDRVNKCEDGYVILFDESQIKELGSKQLDIHVRYWDSCEVTSRYLTSVFMDHATAKDLLSKVKLAIDDKLNLSKSVQLSMDGPSVNFKFHRLLTQDLAASVAEDFKFIDIGSCGLHTIHNAFRAGQQKSGWDLESFFTSLHWLFKDTPARREDFFELTGFEVFPLKFCACRWVENIAVAQRALFIWPHVKLFLRHLLDTTPLQTKSFDRLVTWMKDPLLEAKVETFISIAKLLQPFLKTYQSQEPLVPFLARDLFRVTTSLLQRFLTPAALKQCSTILKTLKVDLDQAELYVPVSKIDVGFKTSQLLKSANLSPKQLLGFQLETRNFLLATVKKIIEKSPLKSKLLRSLAWLNPEVLREAKEDSTCAEKLFGDTVTCLVSCNRVNADDVDELKSSFKTWVSDCHLPEFKAPQRLDSYFASIFSGSKFKSVWGLIKLILVLSHGQAQVERGFSVNKEVMSENLSEKAAVSKRLICDHVTAVGGVMKVELTHALLASVSCSRAKYRQYLNEMKEESEKQQRKRKRDDRFEEVEKMKSKKRQLEQEVKNLEESADKLAEKAERQGALRFITESNALRAAAKKKKNEVKVLVDSLEAAAKEIAGL